MAGRFLRRIPVLAHARYIAIQSDGTLRPRSIERWLSAMERVVMDESAAKGAIEGSEGHRGKGGSSQTANGG